MKRLVMLLVALTLAFALSAGCLAEGKTYTIGAAAYSMDEYGKTWADAFVGYAESLGNVKTILTNADASIDKQLSDVDSLISQNPDIIIVRAIDPDGITAAINACVNANIPVVASDYVVNSDKVAAWIGTNQKDNGILQAEYLAGCLEANPELNFVIGYMWGTMGLSGCQARYDGLAEWVKDCDKANIVSEKVGNWSTQDAMTIMEDWLQGMPEINTIICQNDEMAVGVVNTLRAAGKNMDEYYVLGIDGSENGKKYVKDGGIDCTIGTDLYAQASQTVDLAIRIIDGEVITEPIYTNGFVPITIDSVG